VAGFELAAMNIPRALGYTKIAGTPVVTGFYTALLPSWPWLRSALRDTSWWLPILLLPPFLRAGSPA
jgi:hypothetical protein